MCHYYSDIGTIEVDAYINTRRARVDSIQTINSGEIAALKRVQWHRTAIASRDVMAIAANSPHQICRRDKLSAIFTIVGVQKSVSVRRLLGLDHFT